MKDLNDQNASELMPVGTPVGPIVIDFWAEWCPNCKALMPVVEELARNNLGVTFFKANMEEATGLAAQYGVRSLPTFVLLEGGLSGSPRSILTGNVTPQKLKDWVAAT